MVLNTKCTNDNFAGSLKLEECLNCAVGPSKNVYSTYSVFTRILYPHPPTYTYAHISRPTQWGPTGLLPPPTPHSLRLRMKVLYVLKRLHNFLLWRRRNIAGRHTWLAGEARTEAFTVHIHTYYIVINFSQIHITYLYVCVWGWPILCCTFQKRFYSCLYQKPASPKKSQLLSSTASPLM